MTLAPLWALAAPNDFGAETIEEEGPLPVELVEERPGVLPTTDQPQTTPKAKTPQHTNDDEGTQIDDEMTTLLNVKDVEITALLKSFSKITKRNYIVDSNVKGKVTIHLPTAVTIAEALRILDSVLLLKGFTTVPVEKNTWKVVTAKDAKQTTIPLVSGQEDTPSDALVTQLVRLKYVPAQEMQQAIAQFVSRDGLITPFAGTNSLILIDSAANIDRLLELAKQLDVPAMDQDITIIPIQFAEAKDIADKINQIIGEKEQDKQGNLPRAARAGGAPTNLNPQGGAVMPVTPVSSSGEQSISGKRALPVKVLPDDRTNSVIVVADGETTVKIRAIIQELDSKIDRSGGKFWVHRLRHADAEELANVLNGVITGSGTTSSSSQDSGLSGGSSLARSSRSGSRNSRGRGRFGDLDSGGSGLTQRLNRAAASGGTAFSTGGTSEGQGRVNFEGEVSIAADSATNSLIINAMRNDYMKIKEVIEQLDIKRKQVLVEATILEVSLEKESNLSVELQGTAANNNGGVFAQTNFGGLSNLLTNPAKLQDLTIAAASTGTLTLPGGITIPSQAVLISAVSSNRNVNVLSSPTILTTDNQEAEIVVGQNVPFLTGTGTNDVNLNNTFNSIERQDVGITLRITPQIGIGDFVSLKIFVEISNVVPDTRNNVNGPTTTIRTTETSVEVKSGQMIVTGGLIADAVTEGDRGVPYWEDIPVLGNLFKRSNDSRIRTNLLVFITPKIVSDQFDARESTIEGRERLAKTIGEQETQPDRSEVLFNDRMDRVTERAPETGTKPTTITPTREALSLEEKSAVERTEQFFKQLEPNNTTSQSLSDKAADDDVIELSVTPKLPNSESGTARQMLVDVEATEPTVAGTYVILKAINPGNSPFQLIGGDNLAVFVPGSPNSNAAKFFAIGRRYSYKSGSGPRMQFVCTGRYSSMSEATSIAPELGKFTSWYELTPEEVVQLGRSIWYRID